MIVSEISVLLIMDSSMSRKELKENIKAAVNTTKGALFQGIMTPGHPVPDVWELDDPDNPPENFK